MSCSSVAVEMNFLKDSVSPELSNVAVTLPSESTVAEEDDDIDDGIGTGADTASCGTGCCSFQKKALARR